MTAKPLLECNLEIRWRDLDAYNHVNNQQFLGFIEEARVRWFRSLVADWTQADTLPIVAAISMNYRRPIEWPETLRVELFTERLGGKSLTIGHRILSATTPDVLYADGNTVLVWLDKAGQTVPLPADIRAACA